MCLSHNHRHAYDYPIGRLADEAAFIVSRENGRITTEANLLQMCVAGILSPKARSAFTKQVQALAIETKPVAGLFGESLGLFEEED